MYVLEINEIGYVFGGKKSGQNKSSKTTSSSSEGRNKVSFSAEKNNKHKESIGVSFSYEKDNFKVEAGVSYEKNHHDTAVNSKVVGSFSW